MNQKNQITNLVSAGILVLLVGMMIVPAVSAYPWIDIVDPWYRENKITGSSNFPISSLTPVIAPPGVIPLGVTVVRDKFYMCTWTMNESVHSHYLFTGGVTGTIVNNNKFSVPISIGFTIYGARTFMLPYADDPTPITLGYIDNYIAEPGVSTIHFANPDPALEIQDPDLARLAGPGGFVYYKYAPEWSYK